MKKNIKWIILCIFVIVVAVGLVYKYKDYTYNKKISEEKKQELKTQQNVVDRSPSLKVGDSQTLNLPSADVSNKKFKWSSSDPSVAAVDGNGTVKAVKNGSTVITAVAANGKKESYTVKIKGDSAKSGFNVATEYSPDLFATRIIITLNEVKSADLNKYVVKYAGTQVKLYPEKNSFRIVVDGNVNASTARSKVSVSKK
ncbi:MULTISPECIES: Ig-like domain-containing protein [Clostridium]|uniref:Ig-like domain-containing protein n=1 Tax=Clostridium lapidicellarium TaxID=3240931 RepID=A0ABV4E1E6_9CLOT